MQVRLIAISRPVIAEVPDTTSLLAYMARVSSTANQEKHATGGKLLRSLVARKEWSPFEMISATVEIETTRDIARQILRHRSFSFQEFSQRYAEVKDAPVFREARLQDTKDRQNSIEIRPDDGNKNWLHDVWRHRQQHVLAAVEEAYQWALGQGIAKECARAVLPEGMTPSRLYMAGNLRSWLHYIALRSEYKTQKEHREIAQAIGRLLMGELTELADMVGPE